jgi:Rrf2 family protein
MSLLSTKGIYGLSAMYELSLMQNDKPIQIKEIAKRADIPQNYLEQLLVVLRRAKFVSSVRGAFGGYFLAKKAEDITVKEILIVLEGDLKVTQQSINNPVLELFYKESNQNIEAIFEITLNELQEYQNKISEQLNYSI